MGGFSDVSDLEGVLCEAAQQAHASEPTDAVSAAIGELRRDSASAAETYVPIRELGKGGSGSVTLACVQGTGLKVALKRVAVVGPNGALDALKVKYVLTEAHVLLSIGGATLMPRLYDLFMDGPDACLVTSAAEGGDLMNLLKESESHSCSEAQVKEWAVELVGCLDRLHQAGFVFVDLKPENILLLKDNMSFSEKEESVQSSLMLVDYGLCCCLGTNNREGDSSGDSPLSEMLAEACEIVAQREAEQRDPDDGPSFWGTAEYTAPEVIEKGSAAFSPVSDFWSLGVFMYEMMYGKTPFRGMTNEQTFHNIRMRGPQFPGAEAGRISDSSYDTQQLVRGLLRQKSEYRLGSKGGATEILEHRALRDCREGFVVPGYSL